MTFSLGSSFDPFSWGTGIVPGVIKYNTAAGSAPAPSGGGSTAPGAQPWWMQVAGIGTGVLNSVFGYNLQKQQIKAGQYPSIGYDPRTGNATGQPVTGVGAGLDGSWITWILLALGVVLVFKMVK
jgi:hypothetical protein